MNTDQQEFVIISSAWFRMPALRRAGSIERQFDMLRNLLEFIEANQLCTRPLLQGFNDDPNAFALKSTDLTHLGLNVIRDGLHRWISAIDRGTAPSKLTILQNALKKAKLKPK